MPALAVDYSQQAVSKIAAEPLGIWSLLAVTSLGYGAEAHG
jgi:hypothetical protein